MIYIGFAFFVLSGFFESIMDKLQFHFDKSIFKRFKNSLFWDPSISWKNKYKNGNPKEGEKFFLSKTLFVGLTDAWHFFKLLRNFSIFIGIFFLMIENFSIINSFLIVISARILFGLSFSLFFRVLSR